MKPLLLFMALTLVSGCVGSRVPKTLTAAAEVPVRVPEEPLPVELSAWAETEATAEATAEMSPLGEGETAGLRIAVAEPEARAAAEANLRRNIDLLPLQDSTPLSRLRETDAALRSVIDEGIELSASQLHAEIPEGQLTVRLALPLASIAEAARLAMIADREANPPPTRAEADAEAERLAKREATVRLRNLMLAQPIKGDLTVGDQVGWDVMLEAEVNRAVTAARVVQNRRAIGDTWIVELEAQTGGVMDLARRK